MNVSKFDSDLLTAPRTLKTFIHHYNHKEEIFDLTKRYVNMDKNLPNKNVFSNNFIVVVFLFVTAIISLLVTTLAIYLLCKYEKLRTLVTSLALQQDVEVGAATMQEDVTVTCSCKIQFYFGIKYFYSWPGDFCSSTFWKHKGVQRTFVPQCSGNNAIYF